MAILVDLSQVILIESKRLTLDMLDIMRGLVEILGLTRIKQSVQCCHPSLRHHSFHQAHRIQGENEHGGPGNARGPRTILSSLFPTYRAYGIAGLDIEAMLKAVSSSTSVSLEKLDFDQFDQLPVPVPVDLGPAQF